MLAATALTAVIVAADLLAQIQLLGGYQGKPDQLAEDLAPLPLLATGALVLLMEVLVSVMNAARKLLNARSARTP